MRGQVAVSLDQTPPIPRRLQQTVRGRHGGSLRSRRHHIREGQLLIGEGAEPLTFHAVWAFAHSVGGCERLQICPGELIFLSGEAHVLAQIISPEPGPWGSASGEFVV